MNKMAKLLIGTLLAFGAGAMTFAAGAADSAIGTWTLNVAKSKYDPGPAPKSVTRTYEQTADGISFTLSTVNADGSTVSAKSTYKYDGKDYPITGAPFDTLSLKKINGSTVKATQKKGGKVVGTTVRSVSAHGKVMTVTTTGTDAKGAATHNIELYDKQ
jgi:hypothetical protein